MREKLALETAQTDVSAFLLKLDDVEIVESNTTEYQETKTIITSFRGQIGATLLTLRERVVVPIDPDSRPSTPGSASQNESIAEAFRAVAKSPAIELPTFDGTNIAEYAAFRRKFRYMIRCVNGPSELRASHLEKCIIGNAALYIVSKGNWFDKYEELWNVLDDRYANRWILASDTIRTFFGKKST